jgi:SulP family sulfate permease
MISQPKSLWAQLFPPLTWGREYSATHLKGDLIAGGTTAVMLIPQGMAYALLAGLPPIMGLYASTLPLVIYALLGSSRQLSLGPVAMASLVLGAGLQTLNAEAHLSPEALVSYAVLITLIAGVWQIFLGVSRLGGVVNLLSHPVVTGFTAAAALVIASSQLKHLTGVAIPGDITPHEKLAYLWSHSDQLNLSTLIVGLSAVAIIVTVKRLKPKAPSSLIVVTLGILSAYLFGLEEAGVRTLGAVPSGLPAFSLPTNVTLERVEEVLLIALAVALVSFMESISSAKHYARLNRYPISPTQELVSQGLANMGAACVSGCVVGGALSRTAVNAQAGAKSPLANLVTALLIGLTLTFFTAPFAHLPNPVLAAIIFVAVAGLIDLDELKHLWHVKRDDLGLCVITFGATLFLSVEIGVLVGVISSLLWLVFTTTRPEVATLGKLPDNNSYRSIEHFPEAITYERVLISRMDAQFFFGNMAYLKEALREQLSNTHNPVAVVLDASSMNALDSTAAEGLTALIQELRASGVEVMISHVKGSVLRVMERAGVTEELGEGHMFYEVHDAVQAALRHRDAVKAGLSLEEEDFGSSDVVD